MASDVPPRRSAWLRFAPLAAILALMAAGWAFGLPRSLSFATLVQSRADLAAQVQAHMAWSLALYVVLYVGVVALSIPGGILMTLAGGFLFGWLVGGALALISATTGAVLIFLAARTALAETLAARAGPFLSRFAEGFRKDAFNYLLFLRLVPVFPFWLVNLAPAILGMRLAPYALATFLGILPGTIAFAVIGAGLDRIIAAEPACVLEGTCRLRLKSLLGPELLIGLTALGLIALLPVLIRVIRRRRP
ncbi:TVP38/TMEM64 family protein [Prosthecodimorpha staleyi]|nr:VTT domain-containing protein [Prosthecodimorpha staleyi]